MTSNNVQAPVDRAPRSSAAQRRDEQRDALVLCAEGLIERGGLAALKARDLAACVGCSLGAVYNLVRDMDELTLRVGQRTMAALDAHLAEAEAAAEAAAPEDAETRLLAFARAYRAFASAHARRWRALFEHRIAAGSQLPAWFVADRARVFGRLERCLAARLPATKRAAGDAAVAAQARTLFSAVHGLVLLGLDEKLADGEDGARPPDGEAELLGFVRTYLAGLGSP